ncbi:DUF4236 domain-containing protein [Sphaerisporangium sp. NPDC088356]|uniref:DUF4236 domain-containing protein n=1 Tax=Sphaerisporangium sp. NPDC088356 TaxID=3154871 RepID=UPI00343F837E
MTSRAIYPARRAVEHAVSIPGVRPLRLFPVLWPLWQVEISADIYEEQAYEVIDRFLVRAIVEGGIDRREELIRFYGVGPSLVDRCLAFLGVIGHIVVDGDHVRLTELGLHSLRVNVRLTPKESRQKQLFERFTGRPLPRRYHHGSLHVLPEPQIPDHLLADRSRWLSLFAVTAFQPGMVEALAARPDRTEYNLPSRLEPRKVRGESARLRQAGTRALMAAPSPWLACGSTRTVVQHPPPETRASGWRDRLQARTRGVPTFVTVESCNAPTPWTDRSCMGIYVRTTLKAGPFRFNLSQAGLGVSVGVPGFRVGASPRGNYVRVGGNGFRYQATAGRGPARARTVNYGYPPLPPMPMPSSVVMHDITGAHAQALLATSPSDLVDQMRKASARWPLWPWALVMTILMFIALPGLWGLAAFVVGLAATDWVWLWDRARRSVVVIYDVNDAPAQVFSELVDATTALSQAQKFWFVPSRGVVTTTYQHKVNAGAASLSLHEKASISLGGPKCLVTNIAVPTLNAGQRSIHFLPDRILVRDGSDFADLPYPAVRVIGQSINFIESGLVPSDSRHVGTTWKYVNVKGGPDRRFKDNHQLPIMLYGELTLMSNTGLHSVWGASHLPSVTRVAMAVQRASEMRIPVAP